MLGNGFYREQFEVAGCPRPERPAVRVAPGLALRSVAVAEKVACGVAADGVAYCREVDVSPFGVTVGAPAAVPRQGRAGPA